MDKLDRKEREINRDLWNCGMDDEVNSDSLMGFYGVLNAMIPRAEKSHMIVFDGQLVTLTPRPISFFSVTADESELTCELPFP